MIDKELLDILACPSCKSAVRLENEKIVCANPKCGLKYPIKDGIPVMLIDEAEK
ncbi:MAG: Trm112 family protein [Candidatus Omnitrophica bacterium]|nr:Trm112 family protein [Candidatus Omnitrophota bacterium]